MECFNQSGKPRSTRHRRDVLDEVRRNGVPLSADSMYLSLQAGGSDISLSTVYRVLDHLASVGKVLRTVPMDGSKALYEAAHTEHQHNMICLACHGIEKLPGCPLSDLERRISLETGFSVQSHRLELYGYCRVCNDMRENPEKGV